MISKGDRASPFHKEGLDINVKNLWKQLNKKNTQKVIVANIDTGVDYTSPDLKSVMWKKSERKEERKRQR